MAKKQKHPVIVQLEENDKALSRIQDMVQECLDRSDTMMDTIEDRDNYSLGDYKYDADDYTKDIISIKEWASKLVVPHEIPDSEFGG